MAYSEFAKALRRYRGTRKDGEPCKAFACWDDPRGLCSAHSRHHRGPMPKQHAPHQRSRYEPCRWPNLPEYRLTTPAGTHGAFNGNPYRVFSLGERLNRQRSEKRAREEYEAWKKRQEQPNHSETTADTAPSRDRL